MCLAVVSSVIPAARFDPHRSAHPIAERSDEPSNGRRHSDKRFEIRFGAMQSNVNWSGRSEHRIQTTRNKASLSVFVRGWPGRSAEAGDWVQKRRTGRL